MTCHSIQQLAEVVGGRLRMADLPPLGGEWEPIGRIVADADEVRVGDVLLATPEELQADPFCAEQAYDHGALGIITAGRGVEPWAGKFSIEVDDAQWAMWQLARHGRQQFDGRVIAVTGEAGKSTAAAMIDAVLSPERRGDWNELREDNDRLPQAMLALDEVDDYAVYELHAKRRGELDTAAHLCFPHVGVVLGMDSTLKDSGGDGESSLNQQYGDLISTLPDDGCAVLHEAWQRPLACASQASRPGHGNVPTMTFGRNGACDVVASHVLATDGQLSFVVGGQVARLPVWGRHFLAPALAAWCVGRLSGVSERNIARRLAAFEPLAGRCDVSHVGGVTLIDDTASSAGPSIAASLAVLRSATAAGRRIAVCGDTSPKRKRGVNTGDSSLTLRASVQWGKQIIIAGGADMLLAAGSMSQSIIAGAQAAGMPATNCFDLENSDALQSRIASLAAPGDVVLFKGVGQTVVNELKHQLARHKLPAAA